MTDKQLAALSSAIYLSRLMLAGEAVDTDDKRLRASGLYPDWTPGVHKTGDIYSAAGQVWECIQSYDTGVYPDISPEGPAWRTFHRPLHGTSRSTARPFAAVTGAHDTYKAGEYAIFNGALYRCKAETAYSPAEYAAAWELDGGGGESG